jgi:autotransporter-associated beta strand protein
MKEMLAFGAMTILAAMGAARAGDIYWDGSDSVTWATAANWEGGTAPGSTDTAILHTGHWVSAFYPPSLGANANLGILQFDAGNWTLAASSAASPATLTLYDSTSAVNGYGVYNNAGDNVIGANLTLQFSQIWSIESGTSLTVLGNITGAGKLLSKEGDGTLTLVGLLTYSSGTANGAGTLRLSNGDYGLNKGLVVAAGATVDLNGFSAQPSDTGTAFDAMGGGDIVNNDSRTVNLWIFLNARSPIFAGRIRGNVNVADVGVKGGSLTLDGGSSDFTGTLSSTLGSIYSANTLRLRGATQIASASGVMLGGKFVLDDNASSANSDRLNDGIPVYGRGGTLEMTGRTSAESTETIGPFRVDAGYNTITLAPGTGGSATLTLASLTRANGGVVNLYSKTAGTLRIEGDPSREEIGGKNVLPAHVVFNEHDGFSWSGLAQWDAATKSVTAVAYTSGNLVNDPNAFIKLSGSQTTDGDYEIYALCDNTKQLNFTGTLTLHSGSFVGNYTGTDSNRFKFGANGDREAVICNLNNLVLAGDLITSGGLTKAGKGTLTLNQPASGNWSGATTVNAGTLTFAAGLGGPGNYAIPGDLTVSAGGTVTLTADDQIDPASAVSLLHCGRLNVTNQTLSSLFMEDGRGANQRNQIVIATGATLTLAAGNGSISSTYYTYPSADYYPLITGGTLDLNGPRTIYVNADAPNINNASILGLSIASAIVDNSSGPHGLIKTGPGALRLDNTTSVNTFAGDIVVREGWLIGKAPNGPGTPFGDAGKNIYLVGNGVLGFQDAHNAGTITHNGSITFAGGNGIAAGWGNNFIATLTSLDRLPGTRGTLEWVYFSSNGNNYIDAQNLKTAYPNGATMLPPFFVTSSQKSDSSLGRFVKANATSGRLSAVAPGKTSLASAGASDIVGLVAKETMSANHEVYALQTAYDLTDSGANTLTLGSGGLILNGMNTIAPAVKFGSGGTAEGVVFVRMGCTGTLAGGLETTGGLTKFGPGTLALAADNGCSLYGGLVINDGAVRIANQAAIGGNFVLIQLGAEFRIADSCTLINAISGKGRIRTGANVLTLGGAGSVSPGVAAGDLDTLGTLTVENLTFGGTYNWEYDGTNSDSIAVSTLTFTGSPVVNCSYLGDGKAPVGTHVLFTYTGSAPDVSGVTVNAPAGCDASVVLASAQKRVLVEIVELSGGTVIMVR